MCEDAGEGLRCGGLLVLHTLVLEQVIVQGFPSAPWLLVAQAGLARSGVVTAEVRF